MIAATILQQIGGRRFAVMTGSRDFMDLGDGVRMNLLRQPSDHNARQGNGHLSDAVLPHDGQQTFRGQDERHRSLRGRLLRYVGGDLHLRNGTLHDILIINELKL